MVLRALAGLLTALYLALAAPSAACVAGHPPFSAGHSRQTHGALHSFFCTGACQTDVPGVVLPAPTIGTPSYSVLALGRSLPVRFEVHSFASYGRSPPLFTDE